MSDFLSNFLAKPILIVLAGFVVGMAAGLLPCYILPALGGSEREWCGFKAEPPHFYLQFGIGFILASTTTAYLAYFRRRTST